MWTASKTIEEIARRDYNCEAWEWIDNSDLEDATDEQIKIIEQARKEGCKILKGTLYRKTRGIFEGVFCTYRSRIDLDNICKELELYEI